MRAVRPTIALLLAALGACTASQGTDACTGDMLEACRADGQCRCGARCEPGSDCPATAEGPAGCASRDDGAGVCVDIAWLTGLPRGRVPCGRGTCDVAQEQCVQWADGAVACARRCTANDACASGCCSPLADRSGRALGSVCAPSPSYRCADDAPSGRSCAPACAPGDTCALWNGAPTCLHGCGPDGACGDTCCAAPGGVRVCLPDARRCAAPPALQPACTVMDACVTVTWAALGTRCAAGDSAEVHVRNDCDRPVDVVICYERREGACACAVHRAVQPGAEPDPPSWACGATGRYLVSARAAGDPDACHSGC